MRTTTPDTQSAPAPQELRQPRRPPGKWKPGGLDRARGREKMRLLLAQLWAWRVIDWQVLAAIANLSRSGAHDLLKRARKHGYIQRIISPAPTAVYVLTQAGADAIAEHLSPAERAIRPVTRRGEVGGPKVIHELVLQHAAWAIQNGYRSQNAVGRAVSVGWIAHSLIHKAAAERDIDLSDWLDQQLANAIEVLPGRYLGPRGLDLRPGGLLPDAMIRAELGEHELRIVIEVQQSDETWSAPQQRWASPPERKLSFYAEAISIGHPDSDDERARRDAAERQRRRIDGVLYVSTRRSVVSIYKARWCERLPSVSAEGRGDGRRYHAGGRDGTGPWRGWMKPLLKVRSLANLDAVYYPGRRLV
ncbi:replication-relaxation family protein [Solimonas variicoloris]|uniref:replication-relaxation family protein n=1 Tax=Solimonas variicoloris TaxID=254408 RepID=UPI0012B5622A|nr:replication-relaxation family protein [Solimonas variicoloris]